MTGGGLGRLSRRTKRWVAGAAAVGLVGVGLVATVEAPPAIAAESANPWAQLQLSLATDGTGHGVPGSQTFVNGENGFVPGDNSPTDGVVSSGDSVTYDIALEFEAGAARTVVVDLQTPEYLAWPESEAFCRNGIHVTATRKGSMCEFKVPAGVVESVKTSLMLTAGDTGGRAVVQTLRATVAVRGDSPFAEVVTKPVTVVSAPAVDIVLTARPLTWLDATHQAVVPGTATRWTAKWDAEGVRIPEAVSGVVLATPVPLTLPGFSSQKGAAITGPWSGRLEVGDFPPETLWSVGEGPATLAPDGYVALSSSGGPLSIRYTIPDGWPEQPEGSTVDYALQVIVDSSSFSSAGGYLNNGTGWQPGDGLDRNDPTYDPARGVMAGRPWRNNDWASVRVVRDIPPPFEPALVSKDVVGPWNPFRALWEPENTTYGPDTDERSRQDTPAVPGTQLTARLYLFPHNIPASTTTQLVIGDSWDASEQILDLSREIRVTGPDGVVVPPSRYSIQWSAQPKIEQQIGNPEVMTGWIPGMPAKAEGVSAIRLVFAPDALPTGDEPGAGTVITDVPVIVRPDISSSKLGHLLYDLGAAGAAGTGPNVTFGRLSLSRWVKLVFPPPTTLGIETTVVEVNGGAVPGVGAAAGDVVTFQAVPAVNAMASTVLPVQATVTVTLDRCLTRPVDTSPGWNMTVTDAVPGDSGKVCGDETSTPAILTFSPVQASGVAVSWTDTMAGEGTLPPVTWTAQIAAAVGTAPVTAAAMVAIDPDMGLVGVRPVSDSAQVPVVSASRATARAVGMDAEVSDSFTASVSVVSALETGGGGRGDSVIVLPFEGDGDSYRQDFTDPAGVPASDFHGDYRVTKVLLDSEASSRATLSYTMSPEARSGLSSEAPECCEWVPLRSGDGLPAGATAILLELAEGSTGPSAADLTIEYEPLATDDDPAGNHSGDTYVTWLSATPLPGITTVAPAWPAENHIVASTIGGLVWEDADSDGRPDDGEAGYGGIVVRLYESVDGAPTGAALRETVTTSDGRYLFDELHSGRYAAVMDRGVAIPLAKVSYYDQPLPVRKTYSYLNRFGVPEQREEAQVRSTEIVLARDADVGAVDFGFHVPDPKVGLDKSNAVTTCDAGLCTVSWDVTVTNEGADPLDGVTLYDRLGVDARNVSAVGATVFAATQIAAGDATVYALSPNGEVYAWGADTDGALGDGGSQVASSSPVLLNAASWNDAVIVQVAAGAASAYALTEDGAVHRWGWGADTSVPTPVLVDGSGWEGKTIAALAAGARAAYALASDGTVYSWGANTQGQLGRSADAEATPGVVDGSAWTGTTIVQIASRGDTVYALGADGSVYAWGSGAGGALGNGTTGENAVVPVQLVTADWANGPVVQIAAGEQNGYLLTEAGTVFAWGADDMNQLGNGGTQNPSTVPVAVSTSAVITHIATGGDAVYALASNGTVYAWGAGADARLGTGDTESAATPEPLDGSAWAGSAVTMLAGTDTAGLALADDGQVYSWGAGSTGQLGTGVRDPYGSLTPRWVASSDRLEVDQIARSWLSQAFTDNALALTADGTVYAWGDNTFGVLGNGTSGLNPVDGSSVPNFEETPLPVMATWGDTRITAIASGGRTSYALDANGHVYGWGWASNAQLGTGAARMVTVPVLLEWGPGMPEAPITTIVPAQETTFALDSAGNLYAWGSDLFLGAGQSTGTHAIPIKVPPRWAAGDRVLRIATSDMGAAVVTQQGQVWVWGYSSFGALGVDVAFASEPVRVLGELDGKQITQVALSSYNGYAIDADGVVYSWGRGGASGDASLSLGRPTNASTNLPGVVDFEWSGRPVKIVASGTPGVNARVWVTTDDGSVYAWGKGTYGVFGTEASPDQATPVLVDTSSVGVPAQIAGGYVSGLVLGTNGVVYGWGSDASGSLGNGPLLDNVQLGAIDGPWAQARPWVTLGSRLTPSLTTADDGLVTRAYTLPGTLPPGGTRSVRFTASYLQKLNAAQVVANQAWVDSPLTPKAAPGPVVLPEVGGFDPDGVPGNPVCNTDAPTQSPEDSCDQVPALIPALQEDGLVRIQGQTWVDDPSDGVRVDPALVDSVIDLMQPFEARLDGVIVKLFLVGSDGTPTQIDETTTSAFTLPNLRPDGSERYGYEYTFEDLGGHYYFDDLPPGTYQVQFVIPEGIVPETWPGKDAPIEPIFRAMLPAPATFAAAPLTELAPLAMSALVTAPAMPLATVPIMPLAGVTTGSYSFTVAGQHMHADPLTGMVEPITLAAGQVGVLDAGVFAVGPADLAVVKTPAGYAEDYGAADPLVLKAGAYGRTDPLPVSVTVTNTADEPLTRFTFTDTTLTGQAITGWTCEFSDPARTWPTDGTLEEQLLLAALAAGESFVCIGTLPAMAYDEQHVDSVTIGAVGQITGRSVDQIDDFGAQVLPAPVPGLAVTKASPDGDGTLTEPLYRATDGTELPTLAVFFLVQNTGSEALASIAWADATTDGQPVQWPATPCLWVEVPVDGSDPVEHLLTLSGGVLVEQGSTTPFSLPTGELLTCTGLLPATNIAELHADTVTVSARGEETGEPTMAIDQFATTGTGIGVVKAAVVEGKVVDPEPDVVIVPSTDGVTVQTPVHVTITNLGGEALTDLVLTDVTGAGVPVEDWQCTGADIDPLGRITLDGEPVVLEPAGVLTCTGTLPAMPVGDTHADTVTVTATGIESALTLTASDPLVVAGSGVNVDKVAVVDGQAVDPDPDPVVLAAVDGSTLATPVRVTITNTGNEPVTDVVLTDVTEIGPDVTEWLCTGASLRADGTLMVGDTPLVLDPGDQIACTGELPAMTVGTQHADTVTVTANGVDSGLPLSDDDPLAVLSPDPPSVILGAA